MDARVHRFDAEGKLELSWGEPGSAPGQFNLPHGIAVDSRGDLYVGEVTVSSGAAARLAPFTAQCFQKFTRSG